MESKLKKKLELSFVYPSGSLFPPPSKQQEGTCEGNGTKLN